ncbi:uncharacterized protein [Macrobrachium rosenbergii]|uniref:uncharacterized protein n=1 Tax=Macrobrachium rosenbergii TaxID=79674 RepID=UPI0034D45D0E
MILDRVYRDPTTLSLNIPEHALHAQLEICIKKAPFSNHRGHMYTQIDGVAMGSPLGVLFANFYMGTVEQRVFEDMHQPRMYVRYIDDTFVNVNSQEEIENLRRAFHNHSCLSFTIEHSQNCCLPFLDVLVAQREASFSTRVYTKRTNLGTCMNGASECPKRYKRSTISAYVRRALSHCSSWNDKHGEIACVAQTLIDNGHPNQNIEESIKVNINKWYHQEPRPDAPERIELFYKGQFHHKYKEDEHALKNIIENNIRPIDSNKNTHLVIYYKSKMMNSLVMHKNPAPPSTGPLEENQRGIPVLMPGPSVVV